MELSKSSPVRLPAPAPAYRHSVFVTGRCPSYPSGQKEWHLDSKRILTAVLRFLFRCLWRTQPNLEQSLEK